MKQKSYYLLLLFLFICCIGGCGEDEIMGNTQISPDNKEKMIDVKMYDIGFMFYLQNEHGEPATTFKEGDNFSICWSIMNNREKEVYIDYSFPPDEMAKVYKSDGTFIGLAEGFPENRVGLPYFTLLPKINDIVVYPWIKDDVNKQLPLSVGNYYVGFTFKFDLTKPQNEHYKNAITNDMKFKIYFTVK